MSILLDGKSNGATGGKLNRWQKGESGNPAGRPRKLVNNLNIEGYKLSEINDCIQIMMASTVDELKEIYQNNKATILEKTVANAMFTSLKKGSLYSLDTLLSRVYGKPKESTTIIDETVTEIVISYEAKNKIR
jgi:hypothetical protein